MRIADINTHIINLGTISICLLYLNELTDPFVDLQYHNTHFLYKSSTNLKTSILQDIQFNPVIFSKHNGNSKQICHSFLVQTILLYSKVPMRLKLLESIIAYMMWSTIHKEILEHKFMLLPKLRYLAILLANLLNTFGCVTFNYIALPANDLPIIKLTS